jgi:hypothetical protein
MEHIVCCFTKAGAMLCLLTNVVVNNGTAPITGKPCGMDVCTRSACQQEASVPHHGSEHGRRRRGDC